MRVWASAISAVLRARKNVSIEFEVSPSMTRLSSSRRRSSCIPRLPAGLSCLVSMLPPHSVIATSCLQSVLAAESQRWGLVPQGLGLIVYAGSTDGTVWKKFYQYFRESKFIYVTVIDFLLCTALASFWVDNGIPVEGFIQVQGDSHVMPSL